MSYRISTVAEMTGIPRNTLIAWERRYGLLNPQRHDNRYRSYSDEDVAVLLQIKNALNAGLKISEAVSFVQRRTSDMSLGPNNQAQTFAPPGGPIASTSPYSAFRTRLVELLLAYRGDEAKSMLAQLVSVPFETKLHEIFFPSLREIGELWETGEASVAQEHFASGVIRTHLAALFVTTAQQPLSARHAACTTLPHDEHEIGALALGIQLSQYGYRVSYLGSKMPLDALEGFIEKQKPQLVCVSCITLPEQGEFLRYIERLGRFVERGVRVVLGGGQLGTFSVPDKSRIEFYQDWRAFVA